MLIFCYLFIDICIYIVKIIYLYFSLMALYNAVYFDVNLLLFLLFSLRCLFDYVVSDVSIDGCLFEPSRGKTNNVVSEQVRHKPGCTSTEDDKRLEILDLQRRGIVLSV